MFRQDRTNPSTAVSNWKGRKDTKKGHPQTAVSTWLNGGLFTSAPTAPAGDKGYFAGGWAYGQVCDRYMFATDTNTALVLDTTDWGSLEAHSDNVNAAYMSCYQYYDGASGDDKTIRKMLFASEVFANIGTELITSHYGGVSFMDTTYGYWASGYNSRGTPARLDSDEKMTYSTEAMSSATALSGGRNDCIGFFSTTLGYIYGGYTDAGEISTVQATTLATGGMSTMTSGLTVSSGGTSVSNPSLAGYIYSPKVGSPYDDLLKRTYSTDVTTTLSSVVTDPGYAMSGNRCGVNSGDTFGYLGAFSTVKVRKLTFASDTMATLTDELNATGGAPTPRGGAGWSLGWSP